MADYIDRQAAIDALNEYFDRIGKLKRRGLTKGEKAISLDTVGTIKSLPPIQTDKDKVSDLLYHIYSIQSPHLDMCGVIAKKYYCKELWKELFGREDELPIWMI